MGLVDRIERKLESTVGDAFARVFGGSIVPQEVEAMLHREADAGVRELAGGRILAPNDYVITLSVPDYQKVSADPDLTSTTFARHLEGYIHEQGWQTYGDVVVRFEQSANLHTGQFRARGAVNPDSTTGEPAPALRDRAYTAEPGVQPMTDNPNYRGGQGQGRPDEYYDDRYGRPEDREGGQDPRAPVPARTSGATRRQRRARLRPAPGLSRAGRLPEQGGQPEQPGYPEQGGYPDQGGYPPQQYEQRPPAGYGPPAAGWRLPRPGRLSAGARRLPAAAGGQPGYGGEYGGGDYGRPPAARRARRTTAVSPATPSSGGYPDQGRLSREQGGGYPDQGYGGQQYGRQDYGAARLRPLR